MQKFCSNCGSKLDYDDDIFCSNCGVKLDDNQENTVNPTTSTENKCPSCGVEVSYGTLICPNCGRTITHNDNMKYLPLIGFGYAITFLKFLIVPDQFNLMIDYLFLIIMSVMGLGIGFHLKNRNNKDAKLHGTVLILFNISLFIFMVLFFILFIIVFFIMLLFG